LGGVWWGGGGGRGSSANAGINTNDGYLAGGYGNSIVLSNFSYDGTSTMYLYAGEQGEDGGNYLTGGGQSAEYTVSGGKMGNGAFGGNGGNGKKWGYNSWNGGSGGGGAASAIVFGNYMVVAGGGAGTGGGGTGTDIGPMGQGGDALYIGSETNRNGTISLTTPYYSIGRDGRTYYNVLINFGHQGGYGAGMDVPNEDTYADTRAENQRPFTGYMGSGGKHGTAYYVTTYAAGTNGTNVTGTATGTIPYVQYYTGVTNLGNGGNGISAYGLTSGGGGGGFGGGGGGSATNQGDTKNAGGGAAGGSYMNVTLPGTYGTYWGRSLVGGDGFVYISWPVP